jgi:chorismate synthase
VVGLGGLLGIWKEIKRHFSSSNSRSDKSPSSITKPRNEADLVEIQSGVEGGSTLGTPISEKLDTSWIY